MKKVLTILLTVLLIFTQYIPIKAEYDYGLDKLNYKSRFVTIAKINNQQETEIIYSKNGDSRIYPASMTKVITVYVAAQKLHNWEDIHTFTEADLEALEGSGLTTLDYKPGRQIPIKDLFYLTMLMSAADTTNALANASMGSIDKFVPEMNKVAVEAGMTNTHFSNPIGYHQDDHYTTTNDMIKFLNFALKDEKFKKLYTTLKYTPSFSDIEVTTSVLYYAGYDEEKIKYITGSKTGFVGESNYNLSSYSNHFGEQFITVTSDAYERGEHVTDHEMIYEHLYETTRPYTLAKKGTTLLDAPIKYAFGSPGKITSNEDIIIDLPIAIQEENITEEKITTPNLKAPVSENTELGKIQFKNNDYVLYEKTFSTTKIINRNPIIHIFQSITDFLTQNFIKIILSIFGFFLLIFLFLIYLRHRHIKRRRRIYKMKRKPVRRK